MLPLHSGNYVDQTSSSVAKFGVLTISDRASAGIYKDESGPEIINFFHEAIKSAWTVDYKVIPDEYDLIQKELIRMSDEEDCCLIVTTGGTGPAARDVTPEATEAVCDRMMPGYGEQMRMLSLKIVPTAVLSRQTAGLRGTTLILNLPGKPKAIREVLDDVFVSVPACIDIMREGMVCIETHANVVQAFRPGQCKKKTETTEDAKESVIESKEFKTVVTPHPLDVNTCTDWVRDASCGAISSFIGTTRDTFQGKNVIQLEYEAYVPMAQKKLQEICLAAKSKWSGIVRMTIWHRTGIVPVQEASVIICVSSAHRKDSLESCAWAIDELKATVPIWKKEYFEGGEVWKENEESRRILLGAK